MIRNRAKYRVKSQKDTIRKKWIIYNRFRKSRIRIASDNRKRQNRDTTKTEYRMQCVVIQQENNRDIWHFEVLQDTHNHEHTHNPSASASTRALDKTEDFKKTYKRSSKNRHSNK